jgi:hypothetical protein
VIWSVRPLKRGLLFGLSYILLFWCYSGYSWRSCIPVLGAWLIPGALGGAGPALNLAAKNSKAPRRDD